MSSIFSPMPIYFTGIFSSDTIDKTNPPFEVPSILVSTIPVIFVTFENSLAWFVAFCPVVPSKTNNVSLEFDSNSLFASSSVMNLKPIFDLR